MGHTRIKAIMLILALTMIVLFASSQPMNEPVIATNPKFVISSWAFPDEYGQGIDRIRVEENSTGSWVYAGIDVDATESSAFEWNASVAIKLRCWSWINNTLVGDVSDSALKNYQRHNVIVTQINGTIVFSQDNFTYSMYYYDEDPMFYFEYFVILNFLPEMGQVYTVNVSYEVFYSDTPEGETFGYDSEYGGVLLQGVDRLVGCIFTSPSGTGQSIEKITAEVYAESGTVNIKAVIVDVDTMAIVSNGVSTPVTVTTTQHTWYDFSFSTRPEIEGDTDYCLMLIASGSFRFYYGSDSYTSKYDNSNSYTTPQNPGSWSTQSNTGYSIYATLYVTPESEEWHIINAATFIFVILLDTSTVNTLIIFLGLFMIPASTLYLVKGGKDNLSSDKVFFFIVAFMLGWGLLIGGIYG